MLHINRVTLPGHAGRDPDIRALPDGGRAAAFSLATTERWKRADGGSAERTEWHRIAVYGPAVDPVEAMVRKGAAVLVEGRLAHREFRDREGRDRQIAEIVVAGPQGIVNVLSPRPAGGADAAEAPAAENPGREESAADDAGDSRAVDSRAVDPRAVDPRAGEPVPPAPPSGAEAGR